VPSLRLSAVTVRFLIAGALSRGHTIAGKILMARKQLFNSWVFCEQFLDAQGKTGGLFFDGPRRREAAWGGHSISATFLLVAPPFPFTVRHPAPAHRHTVARRVQLLI
jgi:hypothetical protein